MRNKLGLVILGTALAGVTGCSSVPDAVNPVSWYRDVTGASKNDDLGDGQNQQNLEEGASEPYPNLASVPAAPDTALSSVDRDKLVNSLLADRVNAQYSADNLHAGEVTGNVPPPSPQTRSGSSAPVSATTAAPSPASAAAPPAPPPASSTPATPPAPPPPPPQARNPSPATAANPPSKPPPRGSQAPPAESSLQSPSIQNLPEPETARPAPPAPHIPPPNQVASAAPPSARAPVLRPPSAQQQQQAAAPADVPATAPTHHSGVSYRVADVSFAPGSAYLSGALRGTISEIVKLHNDQGGKIRIVGFGEATGQNAAVAGLTLALDRAQAVAVALTDSGVAAADISVESAPVPARGGADAPRAEVYLEQ
ncbi:MAG TPA: OmpA family protein [Stellaceae bacterium]|nr:OmpA family protein [Stellaceae bacterium]